MGRHCEKIFNEFIGYLKEEINFMRAKAVSKKGYYERKNKKWVICNSCGSEISVEKGIYCPVCHKRIYVETQDQ